MKQIPAVLYFERIDVRKQLDYSGLPQQLDQSILSLDTSISVLVHAVHDWSTLFIFGT
jgi:hypothetical protein